MRTSFWKVILDAETDDVVEVEFSYSGGCAAHMGSMNYAGHPAEGPEIEVLKAWRELPDGSSEEVVLTDQERERCEIAIAENWEDDDYDDYDDYDL